MPSQLFENCLCDFIAPLGRLIRIRRGTDGNFLARFYMTKFLPKQIGGVFFDVDPPLEIYALAHFHKFVGVASITILASELAAAIRIDRPSERHARAGTAIEQRTHRKGEVLDIVSLPERFT